MERLSCADTYPLNVWHSKLDFIVKKRYFSRFLGFDGFARCSLNLNFDQTKSTFSLTCYLKIIIISKTDQFFRNLLGCISRHCKKISEKKKQNCRKFQCFFAKNSRLFFFFISRYSFANSLVRVFMKKTVIFNFD